MVKYLTYDMILTIHDQQVERDGGITGVRDINLLKSAVEQIQQNVFGQELYPSLSDKVARLGFCIARNHVFNDANKRTSLASMLVMLRLNKIALNSKYINSVDCLQFMVDLAAGKKSEADVVEWIENKLILSD